MTDLKRLATYSGMVAPLVAFAAILVAALQSPTFSWTHSPLSLLGADGQPTAAVFNGGLIVAGLVGLPFAWRLYQEAANRLQRVGTGLFGVSAGLMALVGVFPAPGAVHLSVALGHFLAYTFGLWVYGTGAVEAGHGEWGRITAGLGVVHVSAWVVWGVLLLALDPGPIPGKAIPEATGSLIFGGWLIATSRRIVAREEPTPTGTTRRETPPETSEATNER